MAEQDVAFWRRMAAKVPDHSIRDVLASKWQDLREQCTTGDLALLECALQHPDARVRELALRVTARAPAPAPLD